MMSSTEALQRYGSQSKEYRTAYSCEYRALNRRIDYHPSRAAGKAVDEAIAQRWGLSNSEVINQAVVFWVAWMRGELDESSE